MHRDFSGIVSVVGPRDLQVSSETGREKK